MTELRRTVLHERHVALGAKMVPFGGWEMPVYYPTGIVREHLATRRTVGLFDVSHMGRFVVRGPGAAPLLQHVLSSNVQALENEARGAQYAILPNEAGAAVDDAYLYRWVPDQYLLVVNAANREKDLQHLSGHLAPFEPVELIDRSEETVMLALQGPQSAAMLQRALGSGSVPGPRRNAVGAARIGEVPVQLARTGYTGEPIGFEIFAPREAALHLWDTFLSEGATPVGLGARDTLRLEAGLPLYGHELGRDRDGRQIPIMAGPWARVAVSFSPLKGPFIGRDALVRQSEALSALLAGDLSRMGDLPQRMMPLTVTGRGVAREGARVFAGVRCVGYVTSGTMVPYWETEAPGMPAPRGSRHRLRAIALAYVESTVAAHEKVSVEIHGKLVESVVVPRHLRSDAPPCAQPVGPEDHVGSPGAPV